MKKVTVIGGGYGGLTAAAYLAKAGFQVTVLEKNGQLGGRAVRISEGGYSFDVGPSWYFMPEIFERFFARFGKKPSDYYQLVRLDPAYEVYVSDIDRFHIYPGINLNRSTIENHQEGGYEILLKYLDYTRKLYDMAMNDFMYHDYDRAGGLFSAPLIPAMFKTNLLRALKSYDRVVSRYIKSNRLKKAMEFHTVFLGSSPYNTPGLYTLMSHVDYNLGVWYPKGGMKSLTDGLEKLCRELGVEFKLNTEVGKINVKGKSAISVSTSDGDVPTDIVLSNADYHHTETALLDPEYRRYSPKYWDKLVMSPGVLKICLGLNRKMENISHHTLFLAEDWDDHFSKVFDRPEWPRKDLSYYVCCQTKTDPELAPEGHESIDFLLPIAPGLEVNESVVQVISDQLIDDFEKKTGNNVTGHTVFRKQCTINNCTANFNAFKGSAFGPAHTLNQTGPFRLGNHSKKVDNLFYTGHYIHPGVGVPMVFIASEIVANKVIERYEKN